MKTKLLLLLLLVGLAVVVAVAVAVAVVAVMVVVVGMGGLRKHPKVQSISDTSARNSNPFRMPSSESATLSESGVRKRSHFGKWFRKRSHFGQWHPKMRPNMCPKQIAPM